MMAVICIPRKRAVLLTAIACIVLFLFAFYTGFLCHESRTEEQHFSQVELDRKEMMLENLERKLLHTEKELRRRFPSQAAEISHLLSPNIPTIYAITPTHPRPVQKAELIRISQTFLHIPKFHWIVVEDSPHKTDLVTRFLASCGIPYTHLSIATPKEFKMGSKDPNWLKPRGVLQRNLALKWLKQIKHTSPGVVYFADDDNTYELRIFGEMRHTKKVSMWPVGLVGGLRYEGPEVKDGKVVSFFTYWKPERAFPMDMAGFAINLQLLLDHPKVEFSFNSARGRLESDLLEQLVTRDEIEPLADNCSTILVWHTRTEKPKLKNDPKISRIGKKYNDVLLVDIPDPPPDQETPNKNKL